MINIKEYYNYGKGDFQLTKQIEEVTISFGSLFTLVVSRVLEKKWESII